MIGKDAFVQTLPKNYLNNFVARSTLVFAGGAFLTVAVVSLSPPQRVLSYADSFRLISELDRVLVEKSLALFSLAFLFILIGTAALALACSHRVAGALHKLGMHARAITAGDLSRTVRLRKNDVIHELAGDLNDLSSFHSALMTRLNMRTQELSVILESAQFAGALRPESVRDIGKRIDEIRNLLNQIKP